MLQIAGCVAHRTGDAKVHDLDRAILGNHDVGGFDVAVNNPGSVGDLKRSQDTIGHLQDVALLKLALPHQCAQQVALYVLHHDVGGGASWGSFSRRPIFLIASVKYSDDGGVRHLRCRHRFETETITESGVRGQGRLQDFERYLTTQARIDAQINICHATATDDLAHLVAATQEATGPGSWSVSVHSILNLAVVGRR